MSTETDDLIASAAEQSARLLDTLNRLLASTEEGTHARVYAESWHRQTLEMCSRAPDAAIAARREDARSKGRAVRMEWSGRDKEGRHETAELVRKTATQVVLLVGDYPYMKEEKFKLADGEPVGLRSYGGMIRGGRIWPDRWRICKEDLETLRGAKA
jgi:hypothetical protein